MPSANSLKEYFALCAVTSPPHRVLAFPEGPNDFGNLKYYTNGDVHKHAVSAVRYYLDQGLEVASDRCSVVGIAALGTAEWLATFIALSSLGYTVLALSPKLAEKARNLLVNRGNCKVLITDQRQGDNLRQHVTRIAFLPQNEMLRDMTPELEQRVEAQIASAPIADNAFIWHSSGSTGTPKLFPMTQTAAIARVDGFVESLYGKMTIWIESAAYNSAGLTFLLGSLAKSTWTVFYNDRLPHTGAGLVQLLGEARPQMAIFTPYGLELMLSRPQGLHLLKEIHNVSVFGTVCPQHLGDLLVSEGVSFSTGYAMSETSRLMSSAFRPEDDPDWSYMLPFPGPVGNHLWFKPIDSDNSGGANGEAQLCELVILRGLPSCPPERSNSNDPPLSFYSGDLFAEHPSKPGRWKLIGRKDDQINMAMPITINAHEYESLVKSACADEGVDEVVLFGQGRPRLGLLVFVRGAEREENVREAVWAVVQERINGKLKLDLEESMILITRDQVPRTDKSNFVRAGVYARFSEMIEQAYNNRFDPGTSSKT